MSGLFGCALVPRPRIGAENAVKTGFLGCLRESHEHLLVQRRRAPGCLVGVDVIGLACREEVTEAQLTRVLVARFHLGSPLCADSASPSGPCRPYRPR